MFAYLAVEGIRYTRNLKHYCLRLSAFAGIVFMGNGILKMILRRFVMGRTRSLENNVIFTLALGVLAIALILWGKAKQDKSRALFYVLSGVCFATGFFCGEWGSVLLPFMFIEYFFHEKKWLRFAGYVLIEAVTFLLPFGETYWFIVFPFILLYNGERGPETNFSKYFFYVFYPVHLWVIAVINVMMAVFQG